MLLEDFYSRIIIKSILISFPFLLSSCDSDKQVAKYDLYDTIENTQPKDSHKHAKPDNVLVFGFDLRSSPQEDARQYLPFLEYLSEKTGYKFKLHFTPTNSSIVDQLGTNQVQFAAIGAESFVRAHTKYDVIPLVRGLNQFGKAEYQSVFVVLPGSDIKKLHDIAGKNLAFGSRSSTQGHLIPRIVLSKLKISLNSFASYSYTGSHQNCANAVISAKLDVCAMQDTMARNMEKQGLIRIVHTSNYYPSSGIAVNKSVPPDVVEKVKLALLNFKPRGKDKTGLYNWDKTEMPLGFTRAMVNDYTELRDWSIQLGFIQAVKDTGKNR